MKRNIVKATLGVSKKKVPCDVLGFEWPDGSKEDIFIPPLLKQLLDTLCFYEGMSMEDVCKAFTETGKKEGFGLKHISNVVLTFLRYELEYQCNSIREPIRIAVV